MLTQLPLSHEARIAAQQSQQCQHAAYTGPTDALRPHHDDETESELELEMPPGKTPLSLILDGNGIESQRKNTWDLSPHLSRALGWKPL
jgi:hypothetical protein